MSGHAPPVALTAASADEAAVGAVLDNLRTFRHNWWAPVLLGTIMLFDSWDSIAIAYAMPTLSAEWRLNPLTMGFIISAGYGGQFLGAFSLGAFAERLGRMPVLIFTIAGMTVLALACAVAHDYNTLMALRLIQGILIGGAMPVAITYINELAPTKTRGRYFGLYQTLTIAGFSVASLSSPFVIPHLGWRWMFGLGALPLVLLPLVWMTLPESPRWLARRGRMDAANKALAKLGGGPAAASAPAPAPVAAPVAAKTAHPAEKGPGLLALFAPAFAARTLTVTALWFLAMFTSFGLTTWLPSIYVGVFNIPVGRALTYSAINSVILLCFLAAAGTLIDKFGRRTMAMGGLAVTSTTMIALAFLKGSSEMVLVSLSVCGQLGIFFGAFTLWPYTAEIYPTTVRALALGWSSSIGRGASMLTPILVGWVLNQGASISIVFGIFGGFALLALLLWLTRTRETAGKALDTI